MTEQTDMPNFSPVFATEYLSFGVTHDGNIGLAFRDERGFMEMHPLDLDDETDEGVLQLLCKLAGVHPVDIGLDMAEQRRKFDALEENA